MTNKRNQLIEQLGGLLWDLASSKRQYQAKQDNPAMAGRKVLVPGRAIDNAFIEALDTGDYTSLDSEVNKRVKGARRSRMPADRDVTTLYAMGHLFHQKKCVTEANRHYKLAERLNEKAYHRLDSIAQSYEVRPLL